MEAKWMIVPAFALLLSGCTGMQTLKINTVDKDTFFVEVEDFELTNAKVMDLEGASGGKTVVLEDASGKAEATIPLSKGNYEITVYGLGPSYEEDAFFLTVDGNAEQRMWMESPGDIVPTMEYYSYTQQADGPCHIMLSYIEPNVELDRVKFVRIQ
jgi:hypothetical protein